MIQVAIKELVNLQRGDGTIMVVAKTDTGETVAINKEQWSFITLGLGLGGYGALVDLEVEEWRIL